MAGLSDPFTQLQDDILIVKPVGLPREEELARHFPLAGVFGAEIENQGVLVGDQCAVAAVRDLYGTTLSEGASRGILVTTADYGPDAHKFCVDKPITLLNGANLLHLLEKHGIKATIDLQAARALMGLAQASPPKR